MTALPRSVSAVVMRHRWGKTCEWETETVARRLRIRLEGQDARLGQVPAADVARLLVGVERAVARAAAQIAGRRAGLTGRRGAAVEAATRFRLVGLRRGSVIAVLELPELLHAPDELDVGDPSLGELAIDTAIANVTGEDSNPDVADALVQIADELSIGVRYTSLTFEDMRGSRVARQAVIDAPSRERLRLVASQSLARRADAVVGTVFEADFERSTARVRTGRNQVVAVRFGPELADAIQNVLRHQGELVGRVSYDESTGEAKQIDVQRVTRTEQMLLGLDPSRYWQHQSVDDLINERSSPVATRAAELVDRETPEEDVEAFLAAIAGEAD